MDHGGRQPVEGDLVGHRCGHRLDVGGVVARRAADVGVLADLHRCQELLGLRAAHRARHGRHDHVGQPHAVEQFDVGRAVFGVRLVESRVGQVEAVGVLHDELARAQQPGPWASLVPILGLDLVEVQRQVLVGAGDVLHHQGEHLLVRRRKEEVGPLAVLEAEQVVAVLGPPPGRLVRLTGEERGEVHLLETGLVHLVAHHVLDVAEHLPPERKPRETAGGRTPDVSRPDQQSVARHLGVGWVVASVFRNSFDMRSTSRTYPVRGTDTVVVGSGPAGCAAADGLPKPDLAAIISFRKLVS